MDIAVDTVIASRYRVLRELGRGGMGVVYLVEHAHTGDQLALKLLIGHAGCNPEAILRFKREARASARIKSENVVKVVDADVAPELGGAPFLVMELLNGSDLEKLLLQRGRLSPEEVVRYLAQAGRALDRSHAAGIVHRDLKPENIFLHHGEDGATVIKVVDFGISKIMQDPNAPEGGLAGAGMTQTGAVMGTPLYMAPEQARGKASLIGPGTDIWAVGLIAVHLLVGNRQIYWRADNIGELMVQIIAEPLYPPSSRWPFLPPSFDAWFMRSLARDPNDRFKSVGEQIASLAAALGMPHLAAGSGVSSQGHLQAPAAAPSGPLVSTQPSPLGAAHGTASALARTVSNVGMQTPRSPVRAYVALGIVTLAIIGAGGWFGVGYLKSHRPAAATSVDAPHASEVVAIPSTTPVPSASIASPVTPASASSASAAPAASSVARAAPPVAVKSPAAATPQTRASATAHTAVTATTTTKALPTGKKGQDFDAP